METSVGVLLMVAAFALLVVAHFLRRRKGDAVVQRGAPSQSTIDPLDDSRHVHID